MSLVRLLLGRRLASEEQPGRRIGVFAAIPAMGLDALGSSSYGPEAMLAILVPAGAVGLATSGSLTLAILTLLLLLFLSYRQTIAAYPSAGGAFIVATENLGVIPGLVAAAALMVDYILNVAVGISAGVGALVSAIPALHPYILPLCIGVLILVTLVNLRGTRESGWAFALPTYGFVVSFLVIIAIGLFRVASEGAHPQPVVPPPPVPPPIEAIGIWLALRAFASGCTAMTGVEAVSNGISAFDDPPVLHARRTLAAIVGLLATLLGGVTFLAHAYGIAAMNQHHAGYQSVLSQVAGAVIGRGPMYYVAIGCLLCVLCLSANTSFVDFPRLARYVASSGFLPVGFAVAGRRLVYSVGIAVLAGTAGTLLIVFGGLTERLIPLFAVGAFLAFTMSQLGMVVHWWRRREERPWLRLGVNAAGALGTGGALFVIAVTKFEEGAWLTVLAIPAIVLLFLSVRRYYASIDRELFDPRPLDVHEHKPPIVLLPIRNWDRLADTAIRHALRLSHDVTIVHVTGIDDVDDPSQLLVDRWDELVAEPARRAGLPPPRLRIVRARFRQLVDPLLTEAAVAARTHPDRLIAVVIPQIVPRRWWQAVLHRRRSRRLVAALMRHGGPRLVVVEVPWRLGQA